ncbi:MAG TPA: hypothetical protein VIV11_10595 [Kofleriaceae bacterium]
MMRIGPAILFSVALLVVGACDKGKKDNKAGGAPPVAQKDGADGLKAFFQSSLAACAQKDYAKGKALVMSVIPSKDHLKKLFKDEVTDPELTQLSEQFKELPPSDEKAACVFAPEGRTEIRVHLSSVEDLAAYKEGTPAFEEFPGGARKLAEKVLKPGNTFYEVEVTEPGKEQGTKYHMFFWDGGQWRMMGPAWRVLKPE